MLDQYCGITAFKAEYGHDLPLKHRPCFRLGEVAMVTPLLLIMVVLTTGWGWYQRWITIPFSTGERLPLLTNWQPITSPPGSDKGVFGFSPCLLEAAMASRIKRSFHVNRCRFALLLFDFSRQGP